MPRALVLEKQSAQQSNDRFGFKKNMRHSLCKGGIALKKSLEPSKRRRISQKRRDISQKTRDISQKTRDISPKTKDFSEKTRGILKPRPCCLFMLRTQQKDDSVSVKQTIINTHARARTRVYTRVLCFLLSHLSQCFASICKTTRYLFSEGF